MANKSQRRRYAGVWPAGWRGHAGGGLQQPGEPCGHGFRVAQGGLAGRVVSRQQRCGAVQLSQIFLAEKAPSAQPTQKLVDVTAGRPTFGAGTEVDERVCKIDNSLACESVPGDPRLHLMKSAAYLLQVDVSNLAQVLGARDTPRETADDFFADRVAMRHGGQWAGADVGPTVNEHIAAAMFSSSVELFS